jgi:hypothetical protein
MMYAVYVIYLLFDLVTNVVWLVTFRTNKLVTNIQKWSAIYLIYYTAVRDMHNVYYCLLLWSMIIIDHYYTGILYQPCMVAVLNFELCEAGTIIVAI